MKTSKEFGMFPCHFILPNAWEFFPPYTGPIQSNKTKQKTNQTQSNSNHSIGFGNLTKSNTYFAVSSIFEQIGPNIIEQNRTKSN